MITGPVKFSFKTGEVERHAVAFWCVMMRRDLFDELGLLDEIFSPGCGEDGDFCIKAEMAGHELVQVPINEASLFNAQAKDALTSPFPIWHKGSGTFGYMGVDALIVRNKKILDDRYSHPGGAHEHTEVQHCHTHIRSP